MEAQGNGERGHCPWLDRFVSQLNNSIRFLPVAVPVVRHLAIEALRVDPQVPHYQRLEQQSQKVEIIQQSLRSRSQGCGRQRRVNEVTLRRLAQGRFGTQVA